MERLPNSVLENAIRVFAIGEKSALDKCVLSFLKELQELRDAEENGLLVRLPCKVGDILYKSGRGQISEYRVKTIRVEPFAIWIEWDIEKGIFLDRIDGVNANEIGKTVFLTKAEAEAKLKEMEGEDEN